MKYPQFRGINPSKGKKSIGECCACDKPAWFHVIIAFDWMRGNDEVYSTCQRHALIAQDNIKKFLAHVETKELYLKRKSTNEKVLLGD